MEFPTATLRVIAGARRQSPDELLEFIVDNPGCSTGIDFEPRSPMPWPDLIAKLERLPTLDQLRGQPPVLRARVVTLLGMVLYAYCCDPFEGGRTIRGIVCFPTEAEDLERQEQFILVETKEGTAWLFTLDEYEAVFADHKSTVLLPIYGADLEQLPG